MIEAGIWFTEDKHVTNCVAGILQTVGKSHETKQTKYCTRPEV